jgi:pimeloyl-ACP methyl ester carboxylesterase
MAAVTVLVVDGLAVQRFVPQGGSAAPPIVMVHGAMDRASGLRRAVRHLDGIDVTTYDRRGYAGSLGSGIAETMSDQVDDLFAVMDSVTSGPVVLIGHSLGGLIALHASLRGPDRIAGVGAWEPPMPWFDWYVSDAAQNVRGLSDIATPSDAAETFMRAMIGDRLWERLPAAMREERRAEGATLRADLAMTRSVESVLDLTTVTVALVAGCGSESSSRFRLSAARLLADVPHAEYFEVAGAGHGAHLSHPVDFAAFVRTTHSRAPHRPAPP